LNIAILAGVAVLAFFILYPILFVVYGSFWSANPGFPGHFTLHNYVVAFGAIQTYSTLWNTLVYSFGVSVLAVSFGAVLSFITTMTDTPLRRFLYYVPFFPLAFPAFLMNLGWIYLFAPRSGVVNVFFMTNLGLGLAPFNVYSVAGVIWATGVAEIPISYLAIAPSMMALDQSLDDASRVSGANLLRTLRRVTIPLLLPAIASAFVLAFALAVASFEAPVQIGWPAGFYVLMSRIYLNTQNLVPPDYSQSSAFAMLALLTTMTLFLLYYRFLRSARKYQVVSGRGNSRRPVSLGRWKYLLLGVICFYLVVVVAMPLSVLVLLSFVPELNPSSPLSNVSLDNYSFLFSSHSGAFGTIVNSLSTWVISATIVTVVALLIVFTAYMTKIRGRGILEGLGVLPLAVPSLLIGFGLLWAFLTVRTALWGTIGVLVIALVVTLLPQAIRTLTGPIVQIHYELIEASKVSGAATGRTVRRILVPLLRNSLVGTWLYVLVLSSTAVGPIVLLFTPQNTVLSTYIWNDWVSKPNETGIVAAAGILLMAIDWTVIASLLLIQSRLGMHLRSQGAFAAPGTPPPPEPGRTPEVVTQA
jgi:iron(III) transport system permease protein